MAKQFGRIQKAKRAEGFTITSLMDCMTILLTYLIQNFAAEGQILTNADNLVLPNSTSNTSPQEVSLQVAISTDWVTVDNIPIIRCSEIKKVDEISVQAIKDKLEECMENEERMVKIGSISRVKGDMILQVDKNTEYDILYKTMATCGEVGYNHMRFAVMGQEQD